MEGVYLAQPVFIPRPISPLNFEPFEGRPEDVILPGSSDDDSPDTRKRKKRRREQIGTDYLRQQVGYTITFALKGPFEHGWRNPWKEHGVVVDAAAARDITRRAQLKQIGKRASSPIDLTSEPEGGSSNDQIRPTEDRGRAVRNGDRHWLTSNVHSVQQRVSENVDRGSPTPARRRRSRKPTRGLIEENTSDQDHGTKKQVITDGRQPSPIAPQPKIDPVPSLSVEYSLERYYQQLMEGGEMPRCRSPSEELDHSSQEQYRKNGESSIAIHLRQFDTLLHDNLMLLEKTTVQDNVTIIRDQINLVHSVADDRRQLLLQKSVLRRYLSNLIKNLLNIKDLPDNDLHRPQKRSRNEAQSPAAGPSSPPGSRKRQKMAHHEDKHEKSNRAVVNGVPELAFGILQTLLPPPPDTASLTREQKGKGKAEEYNIQEEVIPNQSHSPSVSRDSFNATSQTSTQSQEGQGTSKAARKRRRKREEKEKAEREIYGRKQQELAENAPTETIRNLIAPQKRVEQLEHHSSSPKIQVRVADHKRKFEYLQSTQEAAVPKPNVNKLSVKPSKSNTVRKVSKDQQIHKTPKKRTESHLSSQNVMTPIVGRGEKISSRPANSMEGTAASKGEEMPIICAKDHNSPLVSSQCSIHVQSPSGWKPYKWLPGGHAYAAELLKAHLESIEAGGPDLDPLRRYSQSSSQDISSSEHIPKKQKIEQLLSEPCDPIGTENKVIEPGAEAGPISFMDDDKESSVTGRDGDRQISVDSVNTAWKKDHIGLFGTSWGENHRISTPAPEIPLKSSNHLYKSVGSGDIKRQKQEEALAHIGPDKENKAADTTPKSLAKTAPKLRSCLKGSKMAAAGTASSSPHVVPASTSISEFEYRRINKESRSKSRNATADLEKHVLDTSNPTNAASKRRISFTSSGHIKSSIEIRVPAIDSKNMHASPCSQEGVQILHTLPSPVQDRQDSHGKQMGDLDNPAGITEELPEAQVVVNRPIQLPSGPSTELLETDKSSPKFISTDENDSLARFSTQAELAKAHELFQRELQSPIKYSPLSTSAASSHPDTIPQDIPGNGRALATPLRNLTASHASALNPEPDDHEPLSTQAMVDAMSPFVISTIKKPGKFLNALTRPAAAIFGYMGWGSSSQDRGSQSASQQAPAEDFPAPKPATTVVDQDSVFAKALEPTVDFGKSGLDMETSEDEEGEFDYDLSQPSEFLERFGGVNNEIAAISSAEESDYETTTRQERRVRDDQGRWARLTPELSQCTPSKMTLRSYSSPHRVESPTQDGQRQTAVEQAIDEAGSFLGTWDVEREIRKMKASESGSGEGSGSVAKTSPRAGGSKSN